MPATRSATPGAPPAGVTLTGADTAQPSFTATASQVGTTLTFTLTVTDSDGLTGTDTVVITVQQANRAPVADAGTDQSVAYNASVTLDGSASSDPDSDDLTYDWSGPANITLSDSGTAGPTFTGSASGAHTFTLTVSDPDGLSDTDDVVITVASAPVFIPPPSSPGQQPNNAPTAHAGPDLHVDASTTAVQLDGSQSSDPDTADTLSYSWAKTGGTYDGNETVSIPNGQNPSVTLPTDLTQGETLVITLTVRDGKGGSDTDTVKIVRNTPPTASASASPTSQYRGSVVNLDGRQSSDSDTGDSIQSYSWAKTGGTFTGNITINNEATSQPSFTVPKGANGPDPNQTIIITLTVTDSHGGTGTDTVTVTALNAAPTVNAGSDANANRASSVTLSGSGSDTDGTISYSWAKTNGGDYQGSITIANANQATASFTMPKRNKNGALDLDVDDTIEFTLTVTDNDGAARSDKVLITAKNASPTVSLTVPAIVTMGREQTNHLTANANDPDGDLTYEWSSSSAAHFLCDLDNLSCTTQNANDQTVNVTVPHDWGYYSDPVTVTVTDEDNATASVTEQVATNNKRPSANAGSDQTVNQGDSVSLSGSGSDPDGTIQGYSWEKTGGTYTGTYADLSGATPSFTAPNLTGLTSTVQEKTIEWTLTVTDDDGGIRTDKVEITVENESPTVSLNSAPTTVTNGSSYTVTVSSKDDPDGANGNLSCCTWSVSGSGATITSSGVLTIPAGASLNDAFTVTATITDEDLGTGTGTVAFTVNNKAPTANAGTDASADRGSTVTLSGSGTDTDTGDTVTLLWSRPSGSDGGSYDGNTTITLSSTSAASPTFTMPVDADVGDTVIFKLTASDNHDGAHSDTVTITATNADPTVSLSSPPTYVSNGSSYTITPTGNDPDGDNSKMSYSWSVSDSGAPPDASISSSGVLTIPRSASKGHAYTVEVTAADEDNSNNDGEATATVVFTVNNRAPTASATGDRYGVAGDRIDLNGLASRDPDNDQLRYSWAKTGGTYTKAVSISSANTSAAYFTMPSDIGACETIIVTLTVYDRVFSGGAWSDKGGSDTATRTVNQGTAPCNNQAPSADAGSNRFISMATPKVYLYGTGSDPDGDSISYKWEYITSSTGKPAIQDSTKATAYFNLDSSIAIDSVVKMRLTVTDQWGASSQDEVDLSRQNVAPAPTISADTQTVHTGKAYDISLTAEHNDPDTEQTITNTWSVIDMSTGAPNSKVTLSSTAGATNTLKVASDAPAGDYRVGVLSSDGTTSTSERLTLTVATNRAPTVSLSPTTLTISNPTSPTTRTLTLTTSDADNHSLTCTWSVPATFVGSIAANSNACSGATLTIRPGNQNGDYPIKVVVSDGHGTDVGATLTLTLN